MRFRSKVDRWLAALVFVPMLAANAVTVAAFLARPSFVAAIAPVLLLPALILMLWIFARTEYEIDGRDLIVRSGPFHWTLPISSIISITPTRDPTSSPALSFDRLEIRSTSRVLLVSPQDREGFLAALGR